MGIDETDFFERWLRNHMQNYEVTDQDIERAIADLSPDQVEKLRPGFSQRALDAMHRAAKRRDIQHWIDEAVSHDDHTR